MFEDVRTQTYEPRPLQDLFTDHPTALFVADVLPIPALLATLFLTWLKDKISEDHPDPFTLLGLLDSLATAVGKKSNARHHHACLMVGHHDVPDVPVHISTPREQIKTLVDGVYKVFQREALDQNMPQDQQIKVTLAVMNDRGFFQDFWYFFPTDLAPTSQDAFRNTKTGFSSTVEKGDLFILDNIESELKKERGTCRYAISRNDTGNIGSIVSFPIIIEPVKGYPTIPFVLPVKCDVPKVFCEARKRRYRILAKPFIDRIRLEYYNHIINESEDRYVNDNNSSASGKNVPRTQEGSGRAKAKGAARVSNSQSD